MGVKEMTLINALTVRVEALEKRLEEPPKEETPVEQSDPKPAKAIKKTPDKPSTKEE